MISVKGLKEPAMDVVQVCNQSSQTKEEDQI